MFTIKFFERPWGSSFNVQWSVAAVRQVDEDCLLERLEQADAWADAGKSKGKARMVTVEGKPHFKSPTRSYAAIKALQRKAVSV